MSGQPSLTDELFALVGHLARANVNYALCGGLAMAVHGFPRATMDIDLMVEESTLSVAIQVAAECGFSYDSGEMVFQKGRVRIRRLVKIRDGDHEAIPLDLLVVTSDQEALWKDRELLATDQGPVWVLGRGAMVAMKNLRRSGKDLDDIRNLEGDEGNAQR